jgi:hypothetical protein
MERRNRKERNSIVAKYVKRVDVHRMTREQRAALQPGQHISASGALGRWVGQTIASDVAAWRGNAANDPMGAWNYFRRLRDYKNGSRR